MEATGNCHFQGEVKQPEDDITSVGTHTVFMNLYQVGMKEHPKKIPGILLDLWMNKLHTITKHIINSESQDKSHS